MNLIQFNSTFKQNLRWEQLETWHLWFNFNQILLFLFLESGSIPSRIQDPWVMSRTLDASKESQGLSRKFPGGEGASVRETAVRLSLHVALFLPFLEVSEGCELRWVLHPLDNLWTKRKLRFSVMRLRTVSWSFQYLKHRHEIDIIPGQHLVNELD